jgi:acetoacetyl-CoA reductase
MVPISLSRLGSAASPVISFLHSHCSPPVARNFSILISHSGLIDTPMLRSVAASMNVTVSADMYGRGPVACLGRLGTPLEVAEVVAFLLSPQSGFITGVPITIDGGMSCAG